MNDGYDCYRLEHFHDGPHTGQREIRYSATIQFADGNTRYNPIATAVQLAEWLRRYGVTADVAEGKVTDVGPATQVIIERFEVEVPGEWRLRLLQDRALPRGPADRAAPGKRPVDGRGTVRHGGPDRH